MAGYCLSEGDCFHFGTEFSSVVLRTSLNYITEGILSGVLDKKQCLRENVSHYPNRHVFLTDVNWYDWSERFEVKVITYLRKRIESVF